MTAGGRSGAALDRPSSSARVRLLVAVVAGLVVGLVLAAVLPARYGALGGLMFAAAAYTVWTWLALRHFDAASTRDHAAREDAGRGLTDAVGAAVVVADVAMVVLLLAKQGSGASTVDAVLAVGGVVLSWFLLHTLFIGRYASAYYGGDESGGIDFNAAGYTPTYADFTYFAFNLGMTFQVSDTAVSSTRIRGLVLRHCLLAYFFSTAITATVINLVIGLVS